MSSVTSSLRTGARRLARLFGNSNNNEMSGDAALRAAAAVYLNFCSLTRNVDKDLAAVRYLRLQALRSDPNALRRAGLQRHDVVPTRDISAVWASDLLRPTDMAVSREHSRTGDGDGDGDGVVPAWYAHQQCRLLQSGIAFEARTGTRWQIVGNLGRIARRAGLFAFMGGGLTKFEFPPLVAASAAIGGIQGAIRVDRGIAATPATASFDADASGIITKDERRDALAPWMAKYAATEQMWVEETGTQYRLPNIKAGSGSTDDEPTDSDSAAELAQQPDRLTFIPKGIPFTACNVAKLEQLVQGMRSQDKFASRILALGPAIVEEGWIERAVGRYETFLELARDNPGRIVVPTLDIDLIWHCHMLSPDDYVEDCRAIVGRVLAHDTGHSQNTLGNAFEQTQELWRQATGEPMVAPPPPRKPPLTRVYGSGDAARVRRKKRKAERREENKSGAYGGCGSCGFHLPHTTLPHKTAEKEQVQSLDDDEQQYVWADDSIDADNWETPPSLSGAAEDTWEATDDGMPTIDDAIAKTFGGDGNLGDGGDYSGGGCGGD